MPFRPYGDVEARLQAEDRDNYELSAFTTAARAHVAAELSAGQGGKTWFVDVDGTLARRGERGPYNWSRVGEDEPVAAVIDVVKALKATGATIVVVSGRSDECREITAAWLTRNGVPYDDLMMRKHGDYRSDVAVKAELLDWFIASGRGPVTGVIDDRQAVVDMWRKKGLTCLQAAPGDF